MSDVIENYLAAKYGSGGPGSDRFEPDATEVHASQTSDCQRKRYWKHDRNHHSGPSPYFELGRVFEVLYGAALAYAHDPSTSQKTLRVHTPREVADRAIRVQQDVGITIELGECDIVGECDWVVFSSDLVFDHVTVHEDGSRTVTLDGDEYDYEAGCVEKVVETKTKKDLNWVRTKGPDQKHIYQVYPYIHALDCPGELVYMQRNDWEELVVPVEYDPDFWTDVVMRAKQHHRNMSGDEVPPTSPLEGECKWCPFKDECRSLGGTVWN